MVAETAARIGNRLPDDRSGRVCDHVPFFLLGNVHHSHRIDVSDPVARRPCYREQGYFRSASAPHVRKHECRKADILRWKYRGYRPLRRSDIIVFNYPYARGSGKIAFDFNTLYVKRCVALPGDSVYAKRGAIQVCGVEGTVGIRQYQRQLAFADLSLYPPQSWQTIAPDSAAGKWTIRDFGPIYIPRQGDTIPLDRHNIALYAPAVEFETGIRPRIDSTGRTRLGDSTITHYTFRRNFYFACGDNTMASMDPATGGLYPKILYWVWSHGSPIPTTENRERYDGTEYGNPLGGISDVNR